MRLGLEQGDGRAPARQLERDGASDHAGAHDRNRAFVRLTRARGRDYGRHIDRLDRHTILADPAGER